MMGRLEGQEELFHDFRLDDHVPADHLVRRLDAALDLGFVRTRLAPTYSQTGRPSVDPELMMRMLLVGYLFGIRSERRLCEEVRLNLAYRWFCRLGLTGRTPDHSTFSKNRHGRFREGDLHRVLFEEVVSRCAAAGLVMARDTAIDASTVEADASREKRLPGAEAPDLLRAAEAEGNVSRPVRDCLEALDAAAPADNGSEETTPKYVSPTDPETAWSIKHGPGRFSYATNHLIDTETGCILDVEASPARLGAEVRTTRVMIERMRERLEIVPVRLAADKAYGSAPLLAWLIDKGIEPHIPILERKGQTDGLLTRDAFAYSEATDSFTCPMGKTLRHHGADHAARVRHYRSRPADCAACPTRPACTRGQKRTVVRLFDEAARDHVRTLGGTPDYKRSLRLRRRIERLFAHLKRRMGLARLKLRGLRGAVEEFTMAATAQNLKLLIGATPPG